MGRAFFLNGDGSSSLSPEAACLKLDLCISCKGPWAHPSSLRSALRFPAFAHSAWPLSWHAPTPGPHGGRLPHSPAGSVKAKEAEEGWQGWHCRGPQGQADPPPFHSHPWTVLPPCRGTAGTFDWRMGWGAGPVPGKAAGPRLGSAATQLLVAISWTV